MPNKKSTTKAATKGKATDDDNRRKLRAELAEHLAAIFYNTETPEDLYNYLLTWFADKEAAYLNRLRETPAYAEHLFRLLDFEAKGGAR